MCNQFNEQISINKKHIFDVVPNIYWSRKKTVVSSCPCHSLRASGF